MKRVLATGILMFASASLAHREDITPDARSIDGIVKLSKSFTNLPQGCTPSTIRIEEYSENDGSDAKISDYVWQYIKNYGIETDIIKMRLGKDSKDIQIQTERNEKYYGGYVFMLQLSNKVVHVERCGFEY